MFRGATIEAAFTVRAGEREVFCAVSEPHSQLQQVRNRAFNCIQHGNIIDWFVGGIVVAVTCVVSNGVHCSNVDS